MRARMTDMHSLSANLAHGLCIKLTNTRAYSLTGDRNFNLRSRREPFTIARHRQRFAFALRRQAIMVRVCVRAPHTHVLRSVVYGTVRT
jgi:hypothetical protein